MIKNGVVIAYNGKYGLIKSNNDIIDFEHKDISLNQKISTNDYVEFRIEKKYPNVKIARNINLIKQDNNTQS